MVQDESVIGMIFTEVGAAEGKSIANALLTKVTNALCSTLSIEQINEIKLSFHVFPEHSNELGPGGPTDSTLYPDLEQTIDPKRGARLIKRSMDIAGSLFALVLASPFLVVISVIIKLTSKGPILFCQERVGQHGRKFTFLKFRSMYFTNDHTIHQEYVKRLIAGTTGVRARKWPDAGSLQVDERSENHPVWKVLAKDQPRRSSAVPERADRFDVIGGTAAACPVRIRVLRDVAQAALGGGETRDHRPVASGRPKQDDVRRNGPHGPEILQLVDCVGDIKILLQTPRAVLSGVGAY